MNMCNQLTMASGVMVELVGNAPANVSAAKTNTGEEKASMAWPEGSQLALGAVPDGGGAAVGAIPVVGCVADGGATATPSVGGGKVVTAAPPQKASATTGAQIAARACS